MLFHTFGAFITPLEKKLLEVEICNYLRDFDLISTHQNSKKAKKSNLLKKLLRHNIRILCVSFQDIGLIYKFLASKPNFIASTALNKFLSVALLKMALLTTKLHIGKSLN